MVKCCFVPGCNTGYALDVKQQESIGLKNKSLSWSSVIAVCFDGAATISGCNKGVQAKFKEKNNTFMYIHYYAHCLNLVLVDSIGRKNRAVFDFFKVIYAFIECSCIRHAILKKAARQINIKLVTLQSISTTRWAYRSEVITAIKSNYSVLIIAIQEIYDSTKLPDIRAKAHGLIIQMQSFNFTFALNMLETILLIILKVSSSLQSKDLDLLAAVDLIKSLNDSL
ncbi:zinc finger MYM-type protein 6-like [Aphis gossypii]|uniref:zinc finger MYM-type protein 6-like n=1 Tax=Aphis gossypii TaxID=80765 RepID=UPI0021596A21|nr:zinc finger MYM-type protein 6-like [Aphis gossypii]